MLLAVRTEIRGSQLKSTILSKQVTFMVLFQRAFYVAPPYWLLLKIPYRWVKIENPEESNEATVRYIGGGFGPSKTEHILPELSPAIEFRKRKV